MRRHGLALCLMLALAACKGDDGGDPKPDGGTDIPDPNDNSNFTRLTLESTPNDQLPLALAVGPNDVVGVAYFFRVSDKNYEIRYLQVVDGQVSQPETVATVQLVYGLSLAFDSAGKPAVAYLGGDNDDTVFWHQSDMAVSFRSGANQWTEEIAVRSSNEAVSTSGPSNQGYLVGINPAIVFDGSKAVVTYRDCHNGQFPQQDWNASDLEVAEGNIGSWTHRVLVAGGDDKQAYGGHISMVVGAGGQPALVHDQIFNSPDGTGSNVLFQRRKADGTWTSPPFPVQTVPNTQKGASLAWDATLGYGIAVLDRLESKLMFISCKGNTGTQCTGKGDWTTPDPVYQSGSGGWYPSLAIDPKTHDPSIAFYICSNSPGANESSCPANDDELRVTTRIEGNWREQLVDANGGVYPKMGYLSSSQRVIAYRLPSNGVLMLAVEK
ncbi:hypothetical protein [Hyalangium versicolor]|uniref:hypothetical protein n=1 Tax=Hyalangium versicolor TaxID=2861190 RepID=UPI001CCC22DE|nr:hypothetical protein [Hyalangium versicolor]